MPLLASTTSSLVLPPILSVLDALCLPILIRLNTYLCAAIILLTIIICLTAMTHMLSLIRPLTKSNCNTINKMITNGSVTGMNLSDKKAFFCEDCPLGKQARFPFTSKARSEVTPGEVVHADLCGPMQTPSIGGAKFFLLLKDDCSGFRTVYFLKHKSDVCDYLNEFLILTKNQFGKDIKIKNRQWH